MLTFAHWWVLWLAPLPLLVQWFVPRRRVVRPAVRVPFLPRIVAAGGEPGRRADHEALPATVRWGVWLLALSAVARPQWLEPPIERTVVTRDLLLLVDLSGSMDHQDFTNASGETVDRLTAVKEVLGEFLVERQGDRVGLAVFGTAPFVQAPFTTDLELCRQLLDETAVRMAGPRTALGDAIGLGIRLFDESEVPTKTIIALTDGNDTASAVPPGEAAKVARDRGITIHTVAVGDPTTVGEEALDEEVLRDIADVTQGAYFLALNREELAGVYDRLDEIETREEETVAYRPRRDLYFLPVAALLMLSLAAHTAQLAARRTRAGGALARVRLRVNPRTFELETIET